MSPVHPNHTVTSGLAPDGECGFFSGNWDTDGNYWQHMEHTCQSPARYAARSRHVEDYDYDLCELHAAHVRACAACLDWLASLRTYGLPYVRDEAT